MSRSKILVIYTGGTIGMIKDPVSGQLQSVNFEHIYDHVPELTRLNVDLDTISFENPIDSSEMKPSDWQWIAQQIYDRYNDYDGFVVLHGSDTMAYTASALSFIFTGLKKPIIFTGSQLPIGIIRTDGKENLVTAIEIAAAKDVNGEAIVKEVALYFEYKLFRGNRSTKDSAEHFEAFRSPNFEELAIAGVNIRYNYDDLHQISEPKLIFKSALNTCVAHVKLFPGINWEAYSSIFDKSRIDGVVIESYGSGNACPTDDMKECLSNYIKDGGIVLNITQCNSGTVRQGMYASSSLFNEVGAIAGADMTTEAAITKMMWVLANVNPAEIDQALASNLRGELTGE